MLQDFSQSDKAFFTEALALDPNNADLWYNRSEASCFMLRLGRALRDIERAIECARAIQAYNLPLLSGFMTWLKQSSLSEETIYNHVVNSDFFTTYLVRDEPLKKRDEARRGNVWMFFRGLVSSESIVGFRNEHQVVYRLIQEVLPVDGRNGARLSRNRCSCAKHP